MKYKVGDKVRIKNKEWYEDNCNRYGILECGDYEFFEPMNEYCGEVVTITRVDDCYRVNIDKGAFCWTDEMIEGLVEEIKPKFKVGDSVEVLKSGNVYTISQMKFNGKEFVYTLSNNGSTVSCFSEEEIEFTEEDKYWCDIMSESDPTTYVLPQGYQFVDENGNVINAQKIVLEKKKKEYPKTYEECAKVLLDRASVRNDFGYKGELLVVLQKLLVCRDAYWKIAGDEMGLGKPWEPSGNEDCFVISRSCGEVYLYSSAGDSEPFEFPTQEMRDAFKKNFDPDIEICKELL